MVAAVARQMGRRTSSTMPMRFHDLRGTTATLLARAGAPLVVAQRILRHSDPRLTANVYSRVDLGDLRSGLNRINIPAMPLLVGPSAAPPHVPLVFPRDQLGKTKGRDSLNCFNEITAQNWSGRLDLNQRPLAPQASALPGCATPRFESIAVMPPRSLYVKASPWRSRRAECLSTAARRSPVGLFRSRPRPRPCLQPLLRRRCSARPSEPDWGGR